MNIEEMLAREDEAWGEFVDAFDSISQDARDVQGVVPGWSTKDLVWHCGYWAGYVAGVLEKIARGESTEDSQDWDAFNAMVIDDGRAMSWDQIIVRSEENRARCRQALQSLPDLTEEAVTEFAGETYEHYDEHATEIRAFTGA
jgi:Mycothiol maleylpyruvate isomerase N-terminal domain